MATECHVCGTDLPYDGDCIPCGLRAEVNRLREAIRVHREKWESANGKSVGERRPDDDRLWAALDGTEK